MILVKKCCCKIPLHVGVVLIAIFEIVISIGNIILITDNSEEMRLKIGLYISECFAILVSILALIPPFKKQMNISIKRLLLLPWLTYNAVYCILILSLAIAFLIISAVIIDTVHLLLFLSFTLYLVIYLPFLIYSWIVIYSYYQSLEWQEVENPETIAL